MADDVRKRVQERAREAIDAELGGSGSDDSDGGEVLNPAQIASRGWDTGDYNSFFADCRKDGYGASECGEMWTAMKDSGASGGRSAKPVDNDPDTNDVLVVDEDHDASLLAVQYLADPISEDRVSVAAVDSDIAQNIMQSVDDVPPIPAHYEVGETGASVGDLEGLIQREAV